ncbi:DUF998 domain-containing protein [Intrasporangium sp.]|uniref:DUF998 domain-containing protein n=1 Tax=Intrasporangium sp. TaxID=1925024 RepID=UPI0029397D78|nr:DUF998 domain-containing protein [Intrasporangium sp.]MDV3221039.1 DUF998 domain-containing protein [Intrasporangium sp.]
MNRTPTSHTTSSAKSTTQTDWTPVHVTRSLLGWGVVAGPCYVLTSVAQALLREGFDASRHQWSLLANGDLGWVQVTNFLLTGLMLTAFAVGLGRALAGGVGSRWAPRLAGLFGLSMVVAGVFRADPALGFPVGTPEGPGEVTTSGLVHFAAAGVGFMAIAAACFVIARRFGAEGRRAMSRFSVATGVVFLGGFLCVASGAGSVAANLLFTAAVVLVFTWVAAVARHYYRELGALA